MRRLRNLLAAVALCAAALVTAPQSAHAYDVNGVAFGADVALAGPSGFALSIGLGRLELDFIVGLTLNAPAGGVLEPGFGAAGGVFFTLADGPQTNFQLGGRIGTIINSNGASGVLVTNAAFTFEVDARVEHRFDEHLAINLQVGIQGQVWPDGNPEFVMGFGNTGLVGGAGFRYWFDGLGGGTAMPVFEEPAPAPAARPAPAPAPAPAAEPAPAQQQDTGTATPYWEQ